MGASTSKAGAEGFAGVLAEYDTRSGGFVGPLVEAGTKRVAGGVGVDPKSAHAQQLLFLPAGPVGEFGGLVLFGSGVGFYAGLPQIGGGAYVNVTTNAGCRE